MQSYGMPVEVCEETLEVVHVLGVGDEDETEEPLSLDRKDWKAVRVSLYDHYAVLGLSHLRYKANDAQIKIAHRKKVLKHHPDKKAGTAGDSNDDASFKYLTLSLDPRIKRIKEEGKATREAKKKGKLNSASGTATPNAKEDEEKKKAEEAKKKEEEELAKAEAKKAKAAAANARKARRAERATDGP
ncbi:hypothetical protein JAAARDRAFT_80440 [Jaapia argillacea MUCL 33604]|uniref:J domain-containing protein n=1 Tax=Jaapia argillacea MUCL 33604 TaxID=933084 RepID=A0A067PH62_9AGAM|nr:hypothetical protein JAAARDRAFT_80440 [Jaapia argillacea MUCL 33604]